MVRILLFASSFSVALVLIGIRLLGHDIAWAAASFVAAALLVLPALAIHWYAARGGRFDGKVTDFEPRGESVAGYLATYVLPIILVDPSDSFDVIAVGAFIVFLSLVYAAADLHYLNPLLPLVGLRVWEFTVEAGTKHKFIGISRIRDVQYDSTVTVVGEGPVRLVRAARAAK